MKHRSSAKQKESARRRRTSASVLPRHVPNSSTPDPPKAANGVSLHATTRCQKCQGFLVLQQTDLSEAIEIHCVNCGWQPRWGTKIVTEPEEIRSIRRLTAKFSSESVWYGNRTLRAIVQPDPPITNRKRVS